MSLTVSLALLYEVLKESYSLHSKKKKKKKNIATISPKNLLRLYFCEKDLKMARNDQEEN